LRVRLVAHGGGQPLLLLHGVSLSSAIWVPLFAALPDHRLLAVDLPGHGLSDPVRYRRGRVREHARQLVDDLLDALELENAPVVGHSLGGMFALWYAAADPRRLSRLVAIGDPAIALPGATARMPLSLLAVPGLGVTMLRSPSPRAVYKRLLAQGLGGAEVAAAPPALIDVLRLSGQLPGNARTVASLMRAINRFRRPRPESVLTEPELQSITTPTAFIWGSNDPFLSPARARPSIEQLPAGALHEVAAGHAPWLVDPSRCAELIRTHLSATRATARPERAGAG
jgi:pimeloyl-ACP methyl ester carboxylesterase